MESKETKQKVKEVYLDLSETLIRWEENTSPSPSGGPNREFSEVKEIFCGTTAGGNSLIRFASINTKVLKDMKSLREKSNSKVNLKLISSFPRIYTNAINESFNLGFKNKDIISIEEYLDDEGMPIGKLEAQKNEGERILITIESKNSPKSVKQRQYLNIEEDLQKLPKDIDTILKKTRGKFNQKYETPSIQ